MKSFDLEAAKRGEPIERQRHNDLWEEVRFIGTTTDGGVVIEYGDGSITAYRPSYLRMKPRSMVLAIELWRDERGFITSRIVYENGAEANLWNMGKKLDTISYMVTEE